MPPLTSEQKSKIFMGNVLHECPEVLVVAEIYASLMAVSIPLQDQAQTMHPPLFVQALAGKVFNLSGYNRAFKQFDYNMSLSDTIAQIKQNGPRLCESKPSKTASDFQFRMMFMAMCRLQAYIESGSTDQYELFARSVKMGAPLLLNEALWLLGCHKHSIGVILKNEKRKADEMGWVVYEDKLERKPNKPHTCLMWVGMQQFQEWLKASKITSNNERARFDRAWG